MAADDLGRARRWGTASGIGIALRAAALVGDGVDGERIARRGRSRCWNGRLPGWSTPGHWSISARPCAGPTAGSRRVGRSRDGLRLARRSARRRRSANGPAPSCAPPAAAPARPAGSGNAQLTVSERRVAELAAEGLSNREIAQALFVTSKTVETHLSRTYLKLNVARRSQLGRALATRQDSGSETAATPVIRFRGRGPDPTMAPRTVECPRCLLRGFR